MATVFLSAGHGGKDPGACAYGLKEKDINLQILLACKGELERHGVTVIASRLTDENDAVGQEVKEANASGADIAVSFHTNAGGGDGSESFCNTSNANGKRLAELCEKYTKALGQNSRGVKDGMHLYFIKKTKMTAVLCECAFIDNDRDNDIIDSVQEQQKFGYAYAKAILEYFGIEYKSKSVEIKTPDKPQKTETVKVDYAKSFNRAFAKTYTTKSVLNMRSGAGMNKSVILQIPKGAKVKCYGYYSMNGNTTWLCVSYNGRVGFCGKGYLQ